MTNQYVNRDREERAFRELYCTDRRRDEYRK